MTGAAEALHAALSLATAIWALYSLSTLRRPGPGRSLWAGMVALGTGEALHTQTGYQFVADVTGPAWPAVLYHSAGLVAAILVIDLLHGLLANSTRARIITAGIGVAAIVLAAAALLLDSPRTLPLVAQNDPVSYDDTWQSLVHWATFLTYLACSLIFASWQCAQNARTLQRGPLRTSMLLISAGTAVGLLYVAAHATTEISFYLQGSSALVRFDGPMDVLTLGPCITLIVLGAGWPQLTYLREQLHERAARRATRRRLEVIRPYWARLVAEVPDVSPFADDLRATPTTQPSAEHLDWQQTRMVTEIYDAMRQLLPYLSDEDRALISKKVTSRGLRSYDAQAAAAATTLLLAIRAHRDPATSTVAASVDPEVPAETAADAASHVAQVLTRLRRRRVRTAIAAILQEETRP